MQILCHRDSLVNHSFLINLLLSTEHVETSLCFYLFLQLKRKSRITRFLKWSWIMKPGNYQGKVVKVSIEEFHSLKQKKKMLIVTFQIEMSPFWLLIVSHYWSDSETDSAEANVFMAGGNHAHKEYRSKRKCFLEKKKKKILLDQMFLSCLLYTGMPFT